MKSITAKEVKENNTICKDQSLSNYTVLKDNIKLEKYIFKNGIVFLNIYGIIYQHKIDPIVITPKKDGTPNKKESQTEKMYDDYLDYLRERFERGQVLIKV